MTLEDTLKLADAIAVALKERHAGYKQDGKGKLVRYRMRLSPEVESALWTWLPDDYADGFLRGVPVVIDASAKDWQIEQAGP